MQLGGPGEACRGGVGTPARRYDHDPHTIAVAVSSSPAHAGFYV